MATQHQIAANRENAQHSTGPKTEEGKRRSSQNARKHGLTAEVVVLPNEDAGAFQEYRDQWFNYYSPQSPAEAALIDRAVASKWKLDRCARLEAARLAQEVRHAAERYDRDRLDDAEELGRRLIYEPLNRCEVPQIHDPVVRKRIEARTDANPAILARRLQATAQGVQWLIDRWCELGEMLRLHGFWHYPEKFRAIWMLGRRPEDVLEDVSVQRIYLASNVAHPDCSDENPDSFDLWDECFQSKLGIQGKPMYFHQVDQIRELRPADALTARALLWEILGAEVTRLRALKAGHLDELDRLDRESAGDRAMFDGSKEGVLLRRYETACERELHRSIADLNTLRKAEAKLGPRPRPEPRERNEPTAEVTEEVEVAATTMEEVAASPPVRNPTIKKSRSEGGRSKAKPAQDRLPRPPRP